MDIVEENEENQKPTKEKRKRKKKMINAIQEQLEFYFGDVNLRHDRFLRKEIESTNDGYIDISLMLKFNKLKQISTDLKLLSKAVKNSNQLQLSEDETKLKRIKGLPKLKNTDDQTIYVDQLIAYCDHDYLRGVFSTCGTIDYISLPRYQNSGKIKGFAFIEFSKPEEAEKACQMFSAVTARKNKNKKRHSSSDIKTCDVKKEKRKRKRSVSLNETESPNDDDKKSKRKRSSSISENSYSKEEDNSNICINKDNIVPENAQGILKHIISKENEVDLITNYKDNTNQTIDINKTSKEKKKRKRKLSNESLNDGVVEKRPDLETNDTTEADNDESHNDTDTSVNNKTDNKKKKRKQKHRKRKESETKEMILPPLYVIPKSEWLSLKKQYKNLQLKDMRQLKRSTRIIKSERVKRKELKLSKENSAAPETGDIKVNKEIKDHDTRLQEKTPQNNEIKAADNKAHPKKKEYKQLDMKPGTVMLIKTKCENLNKQSIKDSLSKFVQVSYVDYLNGDDKGYIRFESMEMVDRISKESLKDFKFSLKRLSEQEEKEYFEKALTDQKKRYELNEKRKKKKERGYSKVLRNVESTQSHIHFD